MDDSLNQERTTLLEFDPRQTLAEAWRWVLTRWAEVLCALLLVVMSVQLFAVIARKNITNDEIVHIPAGYYHLVAGEFQLNNEHPPLIKMWAALPLLFIQPQETQRTTDDADYTFREVTWGFHQSFWAKNREQFEIISFWTRAMMILLTALTGVAIFVFARDLFGRRVALIAVALFSLEPTVLAHGRIVHTDLAALLVYLLFFLMLRRYMENRSTKRVFLLGLALGLALTTKFSMIVLLPVVFALAVLALIFGDYWERRGLPPPAPDQSPTKQSRGERRKILLHIAIVVCVTWLCVNAAYRFQSPPLEPGDVRWVEMQSPATSAAWLKFFQLGSKIVPTYYLFGQYNVMIHNRDGHSTSLLGQYNDKGWWYYFPVAFALKTSLPFLLLTIAGLAWSLFQLVYRKDRRHLWLLVPLAIYAALAMTSHINIGVRHFLPEYAFFFVAAAVVLDLLLKLKSLRYVGVGVFVLFCGWMTVETWRAYPNDIPYMNELASQHPHWWYLSDSNVEWGDDAHALADYLHAKGETEVRGAMMGAWGTLGLYGIKYYEIFPHPGVTIPDTKYVVIGASFLNGSTNSIPPDANGRTLTNEQRINYLANYRNLQPEMVFGDAVYLYRMK